MQIAIVNGPNLNLVGTREPDIYGGQSLDAYYKILEQQFPHVAFTYYQSNIEGELINFLHTCRGKIDGIVMNAGAYTHTSIAIPDAIAAINIPVIEVHISNIYAREEYRKTSYTAAKCVGSITGLGLQGYALATQYFADTLSAKTS
ncbi:type II 3-dehydroquinate dehydratase [Chitinophagaceae bacterium IBVUCB1]|nr:type II 3-dehydroquinate dehydratase [Chitinophagaceae bacterium IBVUCB1]